MGERVYTPRFPRISKRQDGVVGFLHPDFSYYVHLFVVRDRKCPSLCTITKSLIPRRKQKKPNLCYTFEEHVEDDLQHKDVIRKNCIYRFKMLDTM